MIKASLLSTGWWSRINKGGVLLLIFVALFCAPLSAISLSAFHQIHGNNKAITYSLSGGRFGDNLIAYLHAQWLARKYNTLFLYLPFPYSDQLALHDYHELTLDAHHRFFRKKWQLQTEKDITSISGYTMILVPYFPEAKSEFKLYPDAWPYHFLVDWKNPEFLDWIRILIAPRFTITTLEMPKEPWITVAVHIRKGGDVDSASAAFDIPLKFPPDSFYIAAIRKMSELLSNQDMYVYLFTDDLNPPKIMNTYNEALKDLTHLHFDCRKTKNGPGINVLEDFFSIQKFDCLIRPESNYTIVAEKLKDFKIIISPKDHHIHSGLIHIDTLNIESNLP